MTGWNLVYVEINIKLDYCILEEICHIFLLHLEIAYNATK